MLTYKANLTLQRHANRCSVTSMNKKIGYKVIGLTQINKRRYKGFQNKLIIQQNRVKNIF